MYNFFECCKDCNKRYLGCQDKCLKYKAGQHNAALWKQKIKKAKKAKQLDRSSRACAMFYARGKKEI